MPNGKFPLTSALNPLMGGLLLTAFSAVLGSSEPAIARNAFETCNYELAQIGISAPERSIACGAALYPKDISACVIRIANDNDDIGPSAALSTCRQVRRPLDLASCVTDINRLDESDLIATTALETCRRSLLPQRFAQCVVGMSRDMDLSTQVLINNCIEARDQPRGFYPNLSNVGQPLAPTPGAPPPLPLIPGIEPDLDQLGVPSR
ncbi:hypothetical protein PMG71_22230 [Roseofilum sp. BLCC_M154]|uniref:Uncharacterized protein n=1 Tax=Roseofilum acuticapitatum BLCC-M154 TaxID=3022444 RepID=A0ABT7AZ36_9CYAN|nr:hypothetical protein [Roseofilum acuticapitatum]MDJ1172151.1 hypothetical protein [Roseofilum acuticapitatum BLCC-M154]